MVGWAEMQYMHTLFAHWICFALNSCSTKWQQWPGLCFTVENKTKETEHNNKILETATTTDARLTNTYVRGLWDERYFSLKRRVQRYFISHNLYRKMCRDWTKMEHSRVHVSTALHLLSTASILWKAMLSIDSICIQKWHILCALKLRTPQES